MKLILIDGGPASGKNTIASLLVKKFSEHGEKAILLDLDTYVEQLNPSWIWKDKQTEEIDQLNARNSISNEIIKYLNEDYCVIVIGERFLTKESVIQFIYKLKAVNSIYLYHLNVPFSIRKKRLDERGPHSLIDLEKDQKERDSVKKWYGYVYENIKSPEEDANNILQLILDNKGLIEK